MRPLIDYINEAIEITNDGYYRTVCLVRRENLDLRNISFEDFKEFIYEDLEKATDEYRKLTRNDIIKDHEHYIQWRMKQASEYAMKKWKTEKRRQEYMQRAKFKAENEKGAWRNNSINFQLEPGPHGMFINQNHILDVANISDSQIKILYKDLMNNEYFLKGIGWAFKYQCGQHDFKNTFSGYVDILMKESDKAEELRDKKELNDAIAAWYDEPGRRWTGD